jgi:hypothetical protein
MLHRQRQRELETQLRTRRHLPAGASSARRRQTIRTLAHGLGASLIATGRMLQSL